MVTLTPPQVSSFCISSVPALPSKALYLARIYELGFPAFRKTKRQANWIPGNGPACPHTFLLGIEIAFDGWLSRKFACLRSFFHPFLKFLHLFSGAGEMISCLSRHHYNHYQHYHQQGCVLVGHRYSTEISLLTACAKTYRRLLNSSD